MTDTPQNKTSESNTPILTVFDDHEIPFATLNNALSRLTSILEATSTAKETFAPIKIKKEHVDFLVLYFHFRIIYNLILGQRNTYE
jgi:hypothetical protein